MAKHQPDPNELINHVEQLTFKESLQRDLSQVRKLGSTLIHPLRERKVKKKMKSPAKGSSKYAPSRVEVAKTVLIAVLITGVIAFVGGMQYAHGQQSEVKNAVNAAVHNVQAEQAKK